MSDLFGNHIVGFPTRRLILCFLRREFQFRDFIKSDEFLLIKIHRKTYTYKLGHENTEFAYEKINMQISCAVTAQLISAFGFTTLIVQSLYF